MGRLGKILSFIGLTRNGAKVRDVKLDTGGGVNATAEHYSAPGDDSHPLEGDYVATVTTMRSGVLVAIGHLDPNNEHTAQAGEKRTYSRDADGAQVAEVWLKNDGSIKGSNAAGVFELTAGGDFVVNGVTIDTNGNITTAGKVTGNEIDGTISVKGLGKELAVHTHPITSGSSAPGPTGQNT